MSVLGSVILIGCCEWSQQAVRCNHTAVSVRVGVKVKVMVSFGVRVMVSFAVSVRVSVSVGVGVLWMTATSGAVQLPFG